MLRVCVSFIFFLSFKTAFEAPCLGFLMAYDFPRPKEPGASFLYLPITGSPLAENVWNFLFPYGLMDSLWQKVSGTSFFHMA